MATEARAIILTLAYTGMRPGELCALRRSDVDLQGLEVVVQRSLDGTGREKAPKNGLARRVILPSARRRGDRARPGAHWLAAICFTRSAGEG